jgi:polyisoprenoid-binding protein YceI
VDLPKPAVVSGNEVTNVHGPLSLTPANTRIEFVGSSEKTTHNGRFKQLTGSIEIHGNDLTTACLSIEIDMNSVDTGTLLLNKELKSADFFDVGKYAHASFVSTNVQLNPTSEATHILIGDFTMHGITRRVSIPVKMELVDGMFRLGSMFAIRQSEFGMKKAAEKTKDEVAISVAVRTPIQ